MTKPPSDMTAVWVRDEEKTLRRDIKHSARCKGQTVADFLHRAIYAAIEDTQASCVAERDRKIGQNERHEQHST